MSPREKVNSVTWVPLSYFEDSFLVNSKEDFNNCFQGTVLSEFPESFLSIIRLFHTHLYRIVNEKHSS